MGSRTLERACGTHTKLSQALEKESGGSLRRAEAANEQELSGAQPPGTQSTALAIDQPKSWYLGKESAFLGGF